MLIIVKKLSSLQRLWRMTSANFADLKRKNHKKMILLCSTSPKCHNMYLSGYPKAVT